MVVFTWNPSTKRRHMHFRKKVNKTPTASPDLLLWLSYFWQERTELMNDFRGKGPQEGTTIWLSDNHNEWRTGAYDTLKAVTPVHSRDTDFSHSSPVGIFVISSQGMLAFSLWATWETGESWKCNFLFLPLTISPNPETKSYFVLGGEWGVGMKGMNEDWNG